MEKNIFWQSTNVTSTDREKLMQQKGCVLWFTGLSGSGKSTVALEVEKKLIQNNRFTYLLDGDNIRHGINSDLSFSPEDRKENIRRIGEISRLFEDAGLITLVSFISPYRKDREVVRNKIGTDRFIEIFVDCPLAVCEQRDVKGLYKLARDGKIKDFTGISAPYESPENPEIHLKTAEMTIEACTENIFDYLKSKKIIR
jgi:adenylyl-sulfate kinase